MMTRFTKFALVVFATASISSAVLSSVGVAQEFYDPSITRAWVSFNVAGEKDVTFITPASGFTTILQDGKMKPLEVKLINVEARNGITVSLTSAEISGSESIKLKLKIKVAGVSYGAHPVNLTFQNTANGNQLKTAVLVGVN
jgi:hypothetical protein